MRRLNKLIIICMIMVAGCISIVYAARVYEISYTNKFQTDIVDVSISEYKLTENGEVPAEAETVMPNQDVSYIPRVTNLRADAYVRVKVNIDMDRKILHPVTLENVYGINPEWVQRGEYFYLTRVLDSGESSDVFTGFHVPEEWENETASGFRIRLSVDAVQEKNFSPDFESMLPWGSIVIQSAKKDGSISYNTISKKPEKHMLTYTSHSGLESETEDLFMNFGNFVAGDTFEDTLKMKNASDSDVKFYFRTETTGSELTEQMCLSVFCAGEKVYEGDLGSDEIKEWNELATVKHGQTEDFYFRVQLPAESDNFYTVLKDEVVWKFKFIESGNHVQTGDESSIHVLYALISVAAFLMMFAVSAGKRGRKK